MFRMVTGMPELPQACIHCGGGPTDNEGRTSKAIWSEGVDVDWGNHVYTCMECAELIADLVHRVPRAFSDKVEAENADLLDRLGAVTKELERAEALLNRIRDGREAVREARASGARQPIEA